ncbi:hypothetical protein ACN20G_33580 (plasmid) [Streptomyces sp. BI20]|uniref:hypothetical protein n=1 Tax=Streptomyces sp. BI20 TaxID=3403460 RepID=UPI003C73D009
MPSNDPTTGADTPSLAEAVTAAAERIAGAIEAQTRRDTLIARRQNYLNIMLTIAANPHLAISMSGTAEREHYAPIDAIYNGLTNCWVFDVETGSATPDELRPTIANTVKARSYREIYWPKSYKARERDDVEGDASAIVRELIQEVVVEHRRQAGARP